MSRKLVTDLNPSSQWLLSAQRYQPVPGIEKARRCSHPHRSMQVRNKSLEATATGEPRSGHRFLFRP